MGKSWLYWIALTVAISPTIGRSGGPGAAGNGSIGSRVEEVRVPESACAMPGDQSAGSYGKLQVIPAFQSGSAGSGPDRLFVPSRNSAPASQPASRSRIKPAAVRVTSAQSQSTWLSAVAQTVRSVGAKVGSTSQPDRPAGRLAARRDLPHVPGEVISATTTARPVAASDTPSAPVAAGEFSQSADRLVARSPNYELICRTEGGKAAFSLTRRDKTMFASVSGDQLLGILGGLDDEATELICSVRLAPAENRSAAAN